MTYRYRAFFAEQPAEGDVVALGPGVITERWPVGEHVPDRWANTKPIRATVRKVIRFRPDRERDAFPATFSDHLGGLWEAICEDRPSFLATTGAVLTVLVPDTPALAPVADLGALLTHLAGRRLANSEQAAAVADQTSRWLYEVVPSRLAYAAEMIDTRPARFATSEEYAAYVEGITLATGTRYGVTVPACPLDVTLPRERLDPEEIQAVKMLPNDTIIARLRGNGRAN